MATQQEQQRGSNWQGREISALINIWGDEEYRHANDDPFTKKKKIMERILTRLGELGYNRSVIQITNKLKQLKTKYKQVLDNNGRSGRARMEWDFCWRSRCHFRCSWKTVRHGCETRMRNVMNRKSGWSGSAMHGLIFNLVGQFIPWDRTNLFVWMQAQFGLSHFYLLDPHCAWIEGQFNLSSEHSHSVIYFFFIGTHQNGTCHYL